MTSNINKFSKVITNNISNGAARSMLYSLKMDQNDFSKGIVGVGTMFYESNPCNNHLHKIAKIVKKNINQDHNKLKSFIFNTIGVSDGMSMGTSGMNFSLPSRELISDSIECFVKAHHYDGLICIPGCDKNLPGSLMGLIRINRPSYIIYGGSIRPGNYQNKDVDIVNAFQSYGELKNNKITHQDRERLLQVCCKGSGACGGMYTANTMAVAIESMGMSLPYSSSNLSLSDAKKNECQQSYTTLLNLIENDIKPSDIITKKSLINAIKTIIVFGGSTNAILHLLAIARCSNIDLYLKDFNDIGKLTPVIANMKPHGQYLMKDISEIGGTPLIMKYMLEEGLLDGSCMTITGKTIEENLENISTSKLKDYKDIFNPKNPIKNTSHLKIFFGNLAPRGAVGKITGKEGEYFKGEALVFESEQEFIDDFENNSDFYNNIKASNKKYVIIIRNQGPKGGPGMPEMLKPTSLIAGAQLQYNIAIITDGRFSGGSHGFIIGHITPEAYNGGPISFVNNGDIIEIDAKNNKIDLCIDPQKLMQRKLNKKKKSNTINANDLNIEKFHIILSENNYLQKYKKNVLDASHGCITI